jgi:hypothetical protein
VEEEPVESVFCGEEASKIDPAHDDVIRNQ